MRGEEKSKRKKGGRREYSEGNGNGKGEKGKNGGKNTKKVGREK